MDNEENPSLKFVMETLGLAEEQIKVYFSVVALDHGTLGQISKVSGLDILKTASAIEDLLGQKLVAKIPSKVNHFKALSPFLRSFIISFDTVQIAQLAEQFEYKMNTELKKHRNLVEKQREQLRGKISSSKVPFEKTASKLRKSLEETSNNMKEIFEGVTQTEKANVKIKRNISMALDVLQAQFGNLDPSILNNPRKIEAAVSENISKAKKSLSESLDELTEELVKKREDIELKRKSFSTGVGMNTDKLLSLASEAEEKYLENFDLSIANLEKATSDRVERIRDQLSNAVSALVFSAKDMKNKLEKIDDAATQASLMMQRVQHLSTDIITGEQEAILVLKDMVARIKSMGTVILAEPDPTIVTLATKLTEKAASRTTIVGKLSRIPPTIIRKAKETGLRLRQLDEPPFWLVIRDANEILIATKGDKAADEEMLGIISQNKEFVDLFAGFAGTQVSRSRSL